MEKPFYISQLPEKTQTWIKEKTKENFLKDGMSEEEAEQKATDFLDEKVNVAEDFFGKDFYKSLDAIKDNFTPPGAIKEATDFLDNRIESADKVIKSTKENLDKQGWDIDKEIAKGKRESELLKEGKKPSEVLETIKKEFDTNDNGEIEVDEMADFQKSLDDYAAKNKKGREDIPATYKR